MSKHKLKMILLVCLLLGGCASQSQSYKPKYKKPDPNKPLPCPLKDC